MQELVLVPKNKKKTYNINYENPRRETYLSNFSLESLFTSLFENPNSKIYYANLQSSSIFDILESKKDKKTVSSTSFGLGFIYGILVLAVGAVLLLSNEDILDRLLVYLGRLRMKLFGNKSKLFTITN